MASVDSCTAVDIVVFSHLTSTIEKLRESSVLSTSWLETVANCYDVHYLRWTTVEVKMSGPEWKGLFEWTMRHSDGTGISEMTQTEIDPAKMAWLQNVLSSYVQDLTGNLREIKTALEEPENAAVHVQHQEALLEELLEIVEDIDQAKNLHLIGGLPMLMDILDSGHEGLKWRAAEVVATCVQNNPSVQQAFFDEGILSKVMSIAQSTHSVCRLKGWMAVSCLIRNFEPAHQAFLEANGFECLLSSLDTDDVRLQRRCLFLLEYLLSQQLEQHLGSVQQKREFEKLIQFMSSEDLDVREKTLRVLSVMVNDPKGRMFLQTHAAFRQSLLREGFVLKNLTKDEKECRALEVQLHNSLKEAVSEDRVQQTENRTASYSLVLKL